MNETPPSISSSKPIQLPAGVSLPGPIWVLLIVVGTSLAHRYLEDPFWADLLITLAGFVLPLVVDDKVDIKRAWAMIDHLTKRPATTDTIVPGTRSMRSESVPVMDVPQEMLPRKANPTVSYLFGG